MAQQPYNSTALPYPPHGSHPPAQQPVYGNSPQPQYSSNPAPQYSHQSPPHHHHQQAQQPVYGQQPPPMALGAYNPSDQSGSYNQHHSPQQQQQQQHAPPPPLHQQPQGYNPILLKPNHGQQQQQHQSPQQPPSNSPPAAVAGGSSNHHGSNPQGYSLATHLARPKWAIDLPSVSRYDHQRVADQMVGNAVGEEAKANARNIIEEAQNEHVKKTIPFNADQQTITKQFGAGCVYFFDFIKFITVANLVLIVLQGINYTLYAVDEEPTFKGSNSTTYGERAGYHDFFITAYQPEHATGWYALNIVSLLFCFIAAPLYYNVMKRKGLPEDTEESSSVFDTNERMLRYNNDCTIDVGYYYRSNGDLFMRRFVSASVFMVLIAVQVGASYAITSEEQKSSDLGTSFGIAILVSALNIIYTFLGKVMTEFEKWALFGRWKRSLTLKLIFFKLANIVTVYAAKDYGALSANGCVYDVIGEQFLSLLIVETFVMNTWELLATLLHAKNYQLYAKMMGSITGDKDNLPQFDLAIEYLEVVYRQYLTILSMVVFPLSVGFATIGFLIEFAVDKIRLYKICGKPRQMNHSQKEFLAFNLVLIAVVSFFTPFAGSLYMMAGWTRDESPLCTFP